MLIVATAPAGLVAWINWSEYTTYELPVVPKFTAVAAANPLPRTYTVVPPIDGPEGGPTLATAGTGGVVYVNWSAVVIWLVPPAVVTVMSTTPTVPPGLLWTSTTLSLSGKNGAKAAPNLTLVAPENPLPLIQTVVPPEAEPLDGLTALTAGVAGVM
jgi:hypothetical protein